MIQDNGTRVSYTASAGQTVFPYPFLIIAATNLKVYINGTLQGYLVNYTVTGVLVQSGGNVVLNLGATAGDVILIYRDIPYELTFDYQDGNQLDAQSLDNEGTLFMALLQQLSTQQLYLTPHYDVTDDISEGDLLLPVLTENKFWMKGPGDAIVAASITPDPGASALEAALASSVSTAGAALVNTRKNITVQTILYNMNQIFSISNSYQMLLNDMAKTLSLSTTTNTVTLPLISQVPAGWWIDVKFTNTVNDAGYVRVNCAGSDTIQLYGTLKLIGANRTARFSSDGSNWIVLDNDYIQVGKPHYMPFNIQDGEYLLMNGAAVSRALYNVLFAKIGTTWGSGDGATTFNLPDMQSRILLGSQQGSYAFNITTVDTGSEELTVASGIMGFSVFTGSVVRFTTTGVLPTGISALTDYYAIYVDATNFKIASSLANAIAGTPINITTTGSGTLTATILYSSRSIGQYGGEESHALTEAELPSHTHGYQNFSVNSGGEWAGGGGWQQDTQQTAAAGSSVAHNIMNPYGAMKPMIKAF